VFANGCLDLLGGRVRAGGLFLGGDCNPTHVAWIYGSPSHGVTCTWNGHFGVPHEEVIVVFNHSHELEEGLLIIIVRTPCTSVANFIYNHTTLWEVECDWVYIIGIENDPGDCRESCNARPCCVCRLFLPGVHFFSN